MSIPAYDEGYKPGSLDAYSDETGLYDRAVEELYQRLSQASYEHHAGLAGHPAAAALVDDLACEDEAGLRGWLASLIDAARGPEPDGEDEDDGGRFTWQPGDTEPDQDGPREDDGPWHDRLAATAEVVAAVLALTGTGPDELAAEVVGLMSGEQKAWLLELVRQYPVNFQRIGGPSGYPVTADAASVPTTGGDWRTGPRLPGPPPGGIWGYCGDERPAWPPRSKALRRERAAARKRSRKRAALTGRRWPR